MAAIATRTASTITSVFTSSIAKPHTDAATKSKRNHTERERTNVPRTCATRNNAIAPPMTIDAVVSISSGVLTQRRTAVVLPTTNAGSATMVKQATMSTRAAVNLPHQIDVAATGFEK